MCYSNSNLLAYKYVEYVNFELGFAINKDKY